jgi:hypothetical protein
MTFLQVTFLLLPIVLLDLASPHHVVFEEIGEMAGALSYIHAIVPINISRLAQAFQTFCYDVHVLQEIYTKK